MITFTVRGVPAPQGSKRAFRNQHSGKIQQVENSKRVAPWRSDVRDAAIDAVTEDHEGMGRMRDPLIGPIAVELAFRMPRPRGHYGSGRNAAVLKASAPIAPAGLPDLDKLARAVLDALTGIVWKDDGQVVDLKLTKRYDDFAPAGVDVRVREL